MAIPAKNVLKDSIFHHQVDVPKLILNVKVITHIMVIVSIVTQAISLSGRQANAE